MHQLAAIHKSWRGNELQEIPTLLLFYARGAAPRGLFIHGASITALAAGKEWKVRKSRGRKRKYGDKTVADSRAYKSVPQPFNLFVQPV